MLQNEDGDRLSPRRAVLLQARCRKSRWHVVPVELGDISQGGCSIVASSELFARGEQVQLRIANLKPIEAQVRWLGNGKIGVEFMTALKGAVIDELARVYGIVVARPGPSVNTFID